MNLNDRRLLRYLIHAVLIKLAVLTLLWFVFIRDAKVVEIEFPVKAGGTRTAAFEVAALDTTSLPKWPQ